MPHFQKLSSVTDLMDYKSMQTLPWMLPFIFLVFVPASTLNTSEVHLTTEIITNTRAIKSIGGLITPSAGNTLIPEATKRTKTLSTTTTTTTAAAAAAVTAKTTSSLLTQNNVNAKTETVLNAIVADAATMAVTDAAAAAVVVVAAPTIDPIQNSVGIISERRPFSMTVTQPELHSQKSVVVATNLKMTNNEQQGITKSMLPPPSPPSLLRSMLSVTLPFHDSTTGGTTSMSLPATKNTPSPTIENEEGMNTMRMITRPSELVRSLISSTQAFKSLQQDLQSTMEAMPHSTTTNTLLQVEKLANEKRMEFATLNNTFKKEDSMPHQANKVKTKKSSSSISSSGRMKIQPTLNSNSSWNSITTELSLIPLTSTQKVPPSANETTIPAKTSTENEMWMMGMVTTTTQQQPSTSMHDTMVQVSFPKDDGVQSRQRPFANEVLPMMKLHHDHKADDGDVGNDENGRVDGGIRGGIRGSSEIINVTNHNHGSDRKDDNNVDMPVTASTWAVQKKTTATKTVTKKRTKLAKEGEETILRNDATVSNNNNNNNNNNKNMTRLNSERSDFEIYENYSSNALKSSSQKPKLMQRNVNAPIVDGDGGDVTHTNNNALDEPSSSTTIMIDSKRPENHQQKVEKFVMEFPMLMPQTAALVADVHDHDVAAVAAADHNDDDDDDEVASSIMNERINLMQRYHSSNSQAQVVMPTTATTTTTTTAKTTPTKLSAINWGGSNGGVATTAALPASVALLNQTNDVAVVTKSSHITASLLPTMLPLPTNAPTRATTRRRPPTTTPRPTPSIDDYQTITSQAGTHAYLPCNVKQLVKKPISWLRMRDGHILTVDQTTFIADQRFQSIYSSNPERWSLQIKFVQPADAGTYECQVSTEPKASAIVVLRIVEPRTDLDGESTRHVKAGSEVKLRCVISQALEPPLFINWFYNQKQIYLHNRKGWRTEIERIELPEVPTTTTTATTATTTTEAIMPTSNTTAITLNETKTTAAAASEMLEITSPTEVIGMPTGMMMEGKMVERVTSSSPISTSSSTSLDGVGRIPAEISFAWLDSSPTSLLSTAASFPAGSTTIDGGDALLVGVDGDDIDNDIDSTRNSFTSSTTAVPSNGITAASSYSDTEMTTLLLLLSSSSSSSGMMSTTLSAWAAAEVRQITTASLIIPAVQKLDSGNYTCSPSNSRPRTIVLHVLNGEYSASAITSGGTGRIFIGGLFVYGMILLLQLFDITNPPIEKHLQYFTGFITTVDAHMQNLDFKRHVDSSVQLDPA